MSWLMKLPDIGLPSLMREAEIAVYLIHNSGDAEDYFFLFDFEEFADRSKAGLFVRPALKIFAGRDDFSRTLFARQFRDVFAMEFDRMRAELAGQGKSRGWLDWNVGVVAFASDFVATLVLGLAVLAGRSLFRNMSLPKILKGKSAEAKLADEIDQTKGQVEAALARIDVTLHPELLDHAEAVGVTLKRADLDRDAWPLPDYVRTHLGAKESGSWW
jgi:hypothetical protein